VSTRSYNGWGSPPPSNPLTDLAAQKLRAAHPPIKDRSMEEITALAEEALRRAAAMHAKTKA